MSWLKFAQSSPDLTEIVQDRLDRKISYLATIRKDGSPRLHPVTPFIGEGMLFIFTEPTSPKIRDLCQDGRYALHCSVGAAGETLLEVLVSGSVKIITDSNVRSKAVRVAESPVITDSYVMFEFQLQRVLVVEYNTERKPIVRHWSQNV